MANPTSSQSSNSNDNKRPDIPVINPDDSGKYIQGIVLQYGYDSVSGIWGAGYSYDNGAHFFVTDTVYGRKYRQEDAERLWKYLEPMIQNLIDKKFEELNDMNKKDGDKQNGSDSNVSE